jgi:hypothetical protein
VSIFIFCSNLFTLQLIVIDHRFDRINRHHRHNIKIYLNIKIST